MSKKNEMPVVNAQVDTSPGSPFHNRSLTDIIATVTNVFSGNTSTVSAIETDNTVQTREDQKASNARIAELERQVRHLTDLVRQLSKKETSQDVI